MCDLTELCYLLFIIADMTAAGQLFSTNSMLTLFHQIVHIDLTDTMSSICRASLNRPSCLIALHFEVFFIVLANSLPWSSLTTKFCIRDVHSLTSISVIDSVNSAASC